MGISLFMEVESFHFWLHPSPDHTPEGMKKKKKKNEHAREELPPGDEQTGKMP